MYKILIVEDDTVIAEALCEHLNRWEYEARAVTDFKNVLADYEAFAPDLLLMDINLPFFNGYYWCAEIRRSSQVPIIFISSAGDNMNIVMAVNMGADDFVAKPFDLQVLTAKIQAVLRRSYDFNAPQNVMHYHGMTLNLNDTTLSYEKDKIELSKNEFRIMQLLLENAGRIVSREEIMQRLWESDSYIDDNTLTVNMTRLRKRLEEIGQTDCIKTKKGLGYLVE